MKQVIRKKITFYGGVQGVGFRYRASHAAQSCGVTGWVRNEWDGSVEMEAQGTEEEIQEMIKLIRMGRYIEVTDMDVKVIPVVEYDRGFHIKH